MQNIRQYARRNISSYRAPLRRRGKSHRQVIRSICAYPPKWTSSNISLHRQLPTYNRLGQYIRSVSTIDQESKSNDKVSVSDDVVVDKEVEGDSSFSGLLSTSQGPEKIDRLASAMHRLGNIEDLSQNEDAAQILKERFEELDFLSKDYESGGGLEPLDDSLLVSCLKAWQDYVFSVADMVTEKRRQAKRPKNSRERKLFYMECAKETELLLGELSPKLILERLLRYYDEESFQQYSYAFHIIVAAMARASDLSQSPYHAHKFFSLLQEEEDNESSYITAESITYQLINLWSKSGLKESLAEIDDYLERLERQYYDSSDSILRPSPNIYCTAMEAHAELGQTDSSFNKIDDLFQRMLMNSKDIDSRAYGRVCLAFAKCRHPKSADSARAVLDEMCHLYFDQNIDSVKPDKRAFSAVMTAYGQSNRPEEAESLLQFMEELAEKHQDPSFRPDFAIYKNVLWALAAVGDGPKAEAMVVRMTSDANLQNTYSSEDLEEAIAGILLAWSKHGGNEGVHNVARLVKQLRETDSFLASPLTAYNAILNSYIGVENPEFSAKLAEDLFGWMESQEDEDIKPDAWSYWNLMLVLKESGLPERCELYLRRLLRAVQDGRIEKSAVDQRFFSLVISAWADSDRPKAANCAHSVFRKMEKSGIEPDKECYASLMIAYSRTRNKHVDQCKEVNALFSEMKQRWSSPLDQKICNAMITTFGRSSDKSYMKCAQDIFDSMDKEGIPKNALIYNSLMRGWSNQNDASRVEAIFSSMKDGYEAGDESLKPRFGDYAARLRIWVKVGEPDIALSIVQEMFAAYKSGLIDRNVSIREANRILESWVSSKKQNAALMTEMALLTIFKNSLPSLDLARFDSPSPDQKDYLEKLACFDSLDLSPDSFSFAIVISALTKSGLPDAATRAFRILDYAEKLHDKSAPCLPNFLTYSQVILGLCSTESGEDISRIEHILDTLLRKDDAFWKDQLQMGLDVWPIFSNILRHLDKLNSERKSSTQLDEKLNTLRSTLEAVRRPRSSSKGKKGSLKRNRPRNKKNSKAKREEV